MTVLTVPDAGTVKVGFTVSAAGALAALTGSDTTCPAPTNRSRRGRYTVATRTAAARRRARSR